MCGVPVPFMYVYDGQLYPGMAGVQVFLTFVLRLRKNPGENLNLDL